MPTATLQDPFGVIVDRLRNSPGPREETPERKRVRQLLALKRANKALHAALSESPMFLEFIQKKLSARNGSSHIQRRDIIGHLLSRPGRMVWAIYLVKFRDNEGGPWNEFGIGVYKSDYHSDGQLYDTNDFTEEIFKELNMMDGEFLMIQCIDMFGLLE